MVIGVANLGAASWCFIAVLVGCGSGGSAGDASPPDGPPPDGAPITPANLPLITPPVRAATPPGLIPPAAAHLVDATDFRSRFFSGSGPTDLFTLLGSVDDRLEFVNTASLGGPHACLSLAPVEYMITPFGQTVPFYAQCYQELGSPNFMQFGVNDGNTYLYVAVGATRLAARLTPVDGNPDQYLVEIWYGVGYTNVPDCSATFDGCTYAVVELRANSATSDFEMAVAGISVSFCGVQIKSDGTELYAEGSSDNNMCAPTSTTCVDATDLTTPGTCAGLMAFDLVPIGRTATTGGQTWGASDYPSTPNITLDGTTSDSLHFAPETPTPGVGNWDG